MSDRRVRLVRELKGAPLSVWMAFLFAGPNPVNQAWLIRTTGHSDKPVRQALAYLSEHGFVIRVQGGWLLSEAAMLLLPGAPVETAHPDPPVEGHASDAGPPASPPNSEANGQIRNNSDSPISIINNAFKDSLNLNNTNNAGRKNSDYTGNNFPCTPLLSDFPDPGAALQATGHPHCRLDRAPPGSTSAAAAWSLTPCRSGSGTFYDSDFVKYFTKKQPHIPDRKSWSVGNKRGLLSGKTNKSVREESHILKVQRSTNLLVSNGVIILGLMVSTSVGAESLQPPSIRADS